MTDRDVPGAVTVLVGDSGAPVFHLPHREHPDETACRNSIQGVQRCERGGLASEYRLCENCANTVERAFGNRALLLEHSPEEIGL